MRRGREPNHDMVLDPSESPICATLLLVHLQDSSVADHMTRLGVDVMALRQKLLQEQNHDGDHQVFMDDHSSDYEGRKKRKPITKEKSHDVTILIRCYNKRALSGLQVQEALKEMPKQELVEFMMDTVLGWKPPVQPVQRRKDPAIT